MQKASCLNHKSSREQTAGIALWLLACSLAVSSEPNSILAFRTVSVEIKQSYTAGGLRSGIPTGSVPTIIAAPDYRLLIIKFTIQNVSSEEVTFDSRCFALEDKDGARIFSGALVAEGGMTAGFTTRKDSLIVFSATDGTGWRAKVETDRKSSHAKSFAGENIPSISAEWTIPPRQIMRDLLVFSIPSSAIDGAKCEFVFKSSQGSSSSEYDYVKPQPGPIPPVLQRAAENVFAYGKTYFIWVEATSAVFVEANNFCLSLTDKSRNPIRLGYAKSPRGFDQPFVLAIEFGVRDDTQKQAADLSYRYQADRYFRRKNDQNLKSVFALFSGYPFVTSGGRRWNVQGLSSLAERQGNTVVTTYRRRVLNGTVSAKLWLMHASRKDDANPGAISNELPLTITLENVHGP